MGTKYNTRTDTFVCSCGSLEHQFVFQIYDFGQGNEAWLEDEPDENVLCSLAVFLPDIPFWQRVKRAIRYIFGYKSRFGQFDNVDIRDADAQRLIEGLTKFRERVTHYRRVAESKKNQIV